MSGKELEEIYQLYLSSIEIYNYAQDRAKSDDKISDKFKIASKNKKNQKKVVQKHFDKLKTDIKEFYILNIITTFEKIIFIKIQQARGDIKKLLTKDANEELKIMKKSGFVIQQDLSLKVIRISSAWEEQ